MSDQLEALLENLAMLEADDLPALGDMHGYFEAWITELEHSKSPILQEAKDGLQTITDIMLGDCETPEPSLELLRKMSSHWQKGKCSETNLKSQVKSSASIKKKSINNDEEEHSGPLLTFMEDAKDHNQQLEELALAMEHDGIKEESIQELMRLIHTLKGEAGVVGLDELSEVCHELEGVFQLKPTPSNSAELLLVFCDWLDDSILGGEGHTEHTTREQLMDVIQGKAQPNPPQLEKVNESTPLTQDPSFYIDFATEAFEHVEGAEQILLESEEGQISEDDINTIFRAFHTIKGVSGFLDLSDIQTLTHRAENVFDKIRSKELNMSSDIQDLCFKVLDKVKELLNVMRDYVERQVPIPKDPSIPNYLRQLDHLLEGQSTEDVAPLPVSNNQNETSSSGVKSSSKKSSQPSSVKVATDRLDQVINLVGELVTSHSMINEELQHDSSKSLQRNLSHMKKNVNELQALAMSLRMVPIKSTFLKMSRIIRDLSKKMGKKIDFEMFGEETELDRNMVDMLGDPLVHMVRNSADHGVESCEKRVAAGKSETGHVELKAFHKGGNIVIQISDDGQGIDRDVILKKAIEKELVSPNQEMSDSEVYQLLFAPGFSTAAKVTDVSGRGVGMDVVKKNIESLRGRIEIESEKGSGSTFSIHLPLTLAIIDGMVIRVGNNRYIVPTVSIDQTFGACDQHVHTVQNQGRAIKFRDHMVPILDFEQIFKDPACRGEGNILMVLGAAERKVAILIDEIVAQQEVVIKSLHDAMKSIKGLSGSAILPDGTVGLILDPIEIAGLLRDTASVNT
jgi:two-component system chemotaxis sensor kinase CheA